MICAELITPNQPDFSIQPLSPPTYEHCMGRNAR
jgi:hypothetical protein